MLMTFKLGMLLGLSIIISIGAQNLFVIQQAMRNEYAYLCALTCFICDVILIMAGAAGVSAVFIEFPVLKSIMLILGIMFLLWYGVSAIRRGISGNTVCEDFIASKNTASAVNSLSKVMLSGLSFSLLNPAAILDTVIIIGGSANHYVEIEKYLFVSGAITASFVWFFGLAAITKFFLRKMLSNLIWRALDFISGGLMLGIALGFVRQLYLAVLQ